MTSKNGATEEPVRLDLPPMTVFGRIGEKVLIAGNEYRLQVRTTSGIIELERFINESGMSALLTPSGQPGDMFVAGAIHMEASAGLLLKDWEQRCAQARIAEQPEPPKPMTEGMAVLRTLLSMMLVEDLPEGIEYHADPAELGAAITKFFKHAGLDWLEVVLKNSAAQATQMMVNGMTRQLMAPR